MLSFSVFINLSSLRTVTLVGAIALIWGHFCHVECLILVCSSYWNIPLYIIVNTFEAKPNRFCFTKAKWWSSLCWRVSFQPARHAEFPVEMTRAHGFVHTFKQLTSGCARNDDATLGIKSRREFLSRGTLILRGGFNDIYKNQSGTKMFRPRSTHV